MKVLITGGGSAGHITPLLAIAAELKKRHPQAQIKYIGKYGDSMRHLVVESPNIEHCYKILAGKWRRYHGVGFWAHLRDVLTILKNLRDIIYFCLGFWQSFLILLFWRPNVLFAKGGFVSLPIGLAAALLRVPIITHDSDATPGVTNKILAKYVKALAVGLPVEAYKTVYPLDKLYHTGVPIREEYYKIASRPVTSIRKDLGYSSGDKIITIVGGSLGAMRLNKTIQKTLKNILDTNISRKLIWITGNRQYQEIEEYLESLPKLKARVEVYNFTNNLAKVLAISDLVISRAGATAIAELASMSKPVILVPNPFLTNGHQLKNASLLEEQEAAIVLQESKITKDPKKLTAAIDEVLSDIQLRQKLSENLHKLAIKDASSRIVDVIEGAL